jgi:ABC-2 type transport system ATP-binding protein
MPESDCYVPRLKGVRCVALSGELAGLPRREALARAHEVLFYVGLGEARYRKVDEYSQGMRQRLRLAQALVHDPELLFLDEPTSGLDPAGRREMLGLVRDLARGHGKHVLLSSHLLPDVEEVCDYALLLRRGEVAAAGEIGVLRGQGDGRYEARLRGDADRVAALLAARGLPPDRPAPDLLVAEFPAGTGPLFAAAAEAGAEVRELRPVAASLEEAMLRLLDRPPSAEAR